MFEPNIPTLRNKYIYRERDAKTVTLLFVKWLTERSMVRPTHWFRHNIPLYFFCLLDAMHNFLVCICEHIVAIVCIRIVITLRLYVVVQCTTVFCIMLYSLETPHVFVSITVNTIAYTAVGYFARRLCLCQSINNDLTSMWRKYAYIVAIAIGRQVRSLGDGWMCIYISHILSTYVWVWVRIYTLEWQLNACRAIN